MRFVKIFLAVLVFAAAAFFVVRGCAPKKARPLVKLPHAKILYQETAPPKGAQPKMAIILDDWGHNLALTKLAVDMRRPLTLSVLPNLAHSRSIAETAHANGLAVIVHMPMQPIDEDETLEPHTIQVDMPQTTILAYLDEAVSAIPYAEGMNNHMGSAATSDARMMRIVLSHLKKKNLFFVDSKVISSTVGPAIAKETGIRFAQRDVFIDNVLRSEAIKERLRDAEKIALKTGLVVVIGHDKKATLNALAEMIPDIESKGIRLVYVREIVK